MNSHQLTDPTVSTVPKIVSTIPNSKRVALKVSGNNQKYKNLGPILDSGSSGTNIRRSDVKLLAKVTSKGGVRITYGGGTKAISSGEGLYSIIPSISNIPSAVFEDEDLIESLVSTHDFCSRGMAVVHTDEALIMVHKKDLAIDPEKVRLYHPKNKEDKLWRLPNMVGLNLGLPKVPENRGGIAMDLMLSTQNWTPTSYK